MEPHDAIGPKQGVLDGTGEAKGKDKTRDGKEAGKRKKSWHLHKKIRKIARLEISDAFENQSTIILFMVATMVFSLIGFWVGMRWMWRSMFG